MLLFLFFISISTLHSDSFISSKLDAALRGEQYKVWVYFDEKDFSKPIKLSSASLKRRLKHGIYGLTVYDYPIKNKYIDHIKRIGVEIKKQSRWLNALSIIGDLEKIQSIENLYFVKKVEPVMLYKKKKSINTIERENVSNRNIEYGASFDQIEQINCRTAHNAGYYGQGVKVLYLDTGFELNHEAYDSLNLIDQYDFINEDQNTANETNQEFLEAQDNHGTMCLSVMAGYAPGKLVGPSFKSQYLLAKTEIVAEEIQQEEDNYVAALEWGESLGVDIICASLGYLDWYSYEDLDGNTAITTVAIDIASSLGILCVNSAGNEGDSPWYYIIAPSDADSIVSVGAVDLEGNVATFSSRGPTYDGRIKPELCALGVNAHCVRTNTSGEYRTASGTSFSAPLVAGAAAVILSANPNWTNMQIREAMIMTASNVINPNNSFGYGIINTWAAINYQFNANIHNDKTIPNLVRVSSAYPNPFNPIISLSIESMYALDNVEAMVYDLKGQLIKVLKANDSSTKHFKIKWNAGSYSSGIYFLKINWPGGSDTQKITLLN